MYKTFVNSSHIDTHKLRSDILTLSRYIQSPHRFNSGTEIKRYISQNFFNNWKSLELSKQLAQGEWNAYAYLNDELVFANALQQLKIQEGSIIVVHPLLPLKLVNILDGMGCIIVSVDVDTQSLAMNSKDFKQNLSKFRENPPECVIQYGFNGLYNEILYQVKIADTFNIPTLLLIDDPDITNEAQNLCSSISHGGVILKQYDNIITPIANHITKSKRNFDLWLSYILVRDQFDLINYNPLNKNKESTLNMLQSLLNFYLIEYEKTGLIGLSLAWGIKKALFQNDIKSKELFISSFHEQLEEIFDYALPDFFFELHAIDSSDDTKKSQIKTKQIQANRNFFERQLETQPLGTIELPPFYSDREYTCYFGFATDLRKWYEHFTRENKHFYLFDIHPMFIDKGFKNVDFVDQYGFYIR